MTARKGQISAGRSKSAMHPLFLQKSGKSAEDKDVNRNRAEATAKSTGMKKIDISSLFSRGGSVRYRAQTGVGGGGET